MPCRQKAQADDVFNDGTAARLYECIWMYQYIPSSNKETRVINTFIVLSDARGP